MSTEAGLAIVNARVWTNDPRRPWADAILVRGERIEIVGSSAEVKKHAGVDTRTIDAKGMMVVPGALEPSSDSLRAGVYAAINLRVNADSMTPAEIGILRAGVFADLTMTDRDLTRIVPEMIGDARVVLTMVRGRILVDRVPSSPDQLGHF